jgi:hypothetical protein
MRPRSDVAKPPTHVVVIRREKLVATIVAGIQRISDALGVRLLASGPKDLLDDRGSGSGFRVYDLRPRVLPCGLRV